MSETYNPTIPIEVGPTSPRMHITAERDLLGRSGLRDARPALARLGHPAAEYPQKVWAAAHDRAVIEMMWKELHGPFGYQAAGRAVPAFYADDIPTTYPDQELRLHWWAWRLRKVVPPEGLAVWETWRREWWEDSPPFCKLHLRVLFVLLPTCFDPPIRTRDMPVTTTGMVSGLTALRGATGCHQRPSLRSDRVHHARSATAVNPLRGSSATLRSFG